MPARLNRRRYREIVATLKEVISDPKATRMQRLRATETLLGVYDRHDRQEERKAVQRRATAPQETPTPADTPEETQETAEKAAARFLESMKQKELTNE